MQTGNHGEAHRRWTPGVRPHRMRAQDVSNEDCEAARTVGRSHPDRHPPSPFAPRGDLNSRQARRRRGPSRADARAAVQRLLRSSSDRRWMPVACRNNSGDSSAGSIKVACADRRAASSAALSLTTSIVPRGVGGGQRQLPQPLTVCRAIHEYARHRVDEACAPLVIVGAPGRDRARRAIRQSSGRMRPFPTLWSVRSEPEGSI